MKLKLSPKNESFISPAMQRRQLNDIFGELILDAVDASEVSIYPLRVRSTGNNINYLEGGFSVGVSPIAVDDVLLTLPADYVALRSTSAIAVSEAAGVRSAFFVEIVGNQVIAKTALATPAAIVRLDNIFYFGE